MSALECQSSNVQVCARCISRQSRGSRTGAWLEVAENFISSVSLGLGGNCKQLNGVNPTCSLHAKRPVWGGWVRRTRALLPWIRTKEEIKKIVSEEGNDDDNDKASSSFLCPRY